MFFILSKDRDVIQYHLFFNKKLQFVWSRKDLEMEEWKEIEIASWRHVAIEDNQFDKRACFTF
jgi:hypothetical protein